MAMAGIHFSDHHRDRPLIIPSVPRSTCCARFLWDVARVASVLGQHLVSGVKSVSRPGVPSYRPDYREPIYPSGVRNSVASTAAYGLYEDVSAFSVGTCRATIRCNYTKDL